MAVFWILELLPLPITSLLPLVLLPLAGVASTDQVATLYLKVITSDIIRVTLVSTSGHQHDVCLQSDHGHRGGAQRLPPQAQPQHDLRPRDQPDIHLFE